MPDNTGNLVKVIDLYFVPSSNIFNNSYIDIEFPTEITLKGHYDYQESYLYPENIPIFNLFATIP